MTSRPNVPAICPSASSIIRSAASLPPGPWGGFPDLTGTISRLRLLAPRRASLRFLRSALPPLRPLRSPQSRTILRGPGPLLSRRPRRLTTVEKTRPPRFLDDPCVHAPLFDPGGPPTPGHFRTGDVVFRTLNNVDSALAPFEARSRGLHALCVRFAAGVAPGPRNTRFRLVASLDRSGLSPAGSHRWFTVMSLRLHGVLHHQASPGATKDGLPGLRNKFVPSAVSRPFTERRHAGDAAVRPIGQPGPRGNRRLNVLPSYRKRETKRVARRLAAASRRRPCTSPILRRHRAG